MRKIIQVFATPATDRTKGTLFALCDDGSLWTRIIYQHDKWHRVDDIPQDKDES